MFRRTGFSIRKINFRLAGNSSEQFPLYQIKRGEGRKILLSGVVHGDEPAGIYAILSFFENYIHEYENDFEFTAFPCVNPWGFQNFTRLVIKSKFE